MRGRDDPAIHLDESSSSTGCLSLIRKCMAQNIPATRPTIANRIPLFPPH